MIIKAIVLLCLTQYLMCEVAMMSTPASSNNQTDKANQVEIIMTDDVEDSAPDDSDKDFFDRVIVTIIMLLEYLFPVAMGSTGSFSTTMDSFISLMD
ncbi:uncharacterized protein DC041_0005029 [Schistosoma bovis]|uniref:Uncharacterized protein n=1 Tax=Schistosoma bovis TaxID=6184 RepID=A0A430Q491_SCHBO|nr:uncharacterized protein DC041_0005029 [Schistosoma bovis]